MLIWADGFAHYGNTQNLINSGQYLWHTKYNDPNLGIGNNPAYARTGAYYFDATGLSGPYSWAGRFFGGNSQLVGAGAAFFFPPTPDNDGWAPFMFCCNDKNSFQCSVRLHPDGSLSFWNSTEGEMLGQSNPGVIVWGAYSYIECKVYCDPVQGAYTVRVNNAVVLAGEGVNTDPLGTNKIQGVMSGSRPGGYTGSFCTAIADYVIWDNTGTHNNDFFGDIRCRTIFPEANGLNQNWQPNGLADAFACVSQVPPQPNVDYISAANVGDVSTFNLSGVPLNTGNIYGVMMFANINKADAGVCSVEAGIASGGHTAVTDPINPGTGSAYYTKAFQTNPDGDVAWTKDSVNAMQAIIERVA